MESVSGVFVIFPKVFDPPHVIVFSNHPPELTNLSVDRWNLIDNLGDDMKLHDFFPPARFPEVKGLRDPFEEAEVVPVVRSLPAPPLGACDSPPPMAPPAAPPPAAAEEGGRISTRQAPIGSMIRGMPSCESTQRRWTLRQRALPYGESRSASTFQPSPMMSSSPGFPRASRRARQSMRARTTTRPRMVKKT